MIGAIYARYSDGPQQTDQSIEGQVRDCEKYAEQNGIQVAEVYADRHISGRSTAGRTEFLRMLDDARRGCFECVIVWKIDRFGRNRQDIALAKMQLKRAGVQLRYAVESVPDGPEGIILESVLEGLAEYYSADLSQKVKRGIRENINKGISYGMIPLGYKLDAERHILIDEETAPLVREAFRMHINGATKRQISDMLARNGILSRNGTPYSTNAIFRMLRNERYIGKWSLQQPVLHHIAILDMNTYNTAQASHKAHRGHPVKEYILSGIAFCECGEPLVGDMCTSKNGSQHRYYMCRSARKKKGCGNGRIQKDRLEEAVIRATCQDMLTDEMIEKMCAGIMRYQEEEYDPVNSFTAQLKSVRERKDNIVKAIENGVDARTLAHRLKSLEAEEDELTVKIANMQVRHPRLTEEQVRALLRRYQRMDVTDPDVRREMIRTFVARVELKKDAVLLLYNLTDSPCRSVRTASDWWALCAAVRTPVVRGTLAAYLIRLAI